MVLEDQKFVDVKNHRYYEAVALQKSGKLQDALQIYRSIIFKNRKNANAYFKAAQVRQALGQFHLAEINYKHALRLGCDSLTIYRDVSELFRKQGLAEKAAQYQEIYLSKLPKPEIKNNNAGLLAASKIIQKEESVQNSETKLAENNPENSKDSAKTTLVLNNADVKSEMPLKTVFYLIGSGFLILLFSIIGISRYRDKKQVQKPVQSFENIQGSLDKIEHDLQREKLMEKVREIRNRVNEYEELPVTQTEIKEEIAENEEPIFEPESMEMLRKKSPFLLNEEYDIPETTEMAKNLNLGIGEVELALNLKAHQRKVNNTFSVEAKINQLFEKHKDVSEVARIMQMGQGEVQLFLKMRDHEMAI